MKKHTVLTVFLACLLFTSIVHAQTSQKIITLKDGSIIKGTVVSVENQKYIIDTNNLGKIEVADTDIVSIVSPGTGQVPANQNALGNLGGLGNLGMSGQMQQMQNSLMSDPNMMAEMQAMLQDEEIMALISDPNIMKDLMSNDPSVIQNNPKIMQLMNNPQMQALVQMMMNKGIGQK
ncbi:MAG: hypothetical protein KKD07_08875 [Candidatus Omnitrophica bacterium]|nr:hypothetical protein [Candidatus Omnitrophota bacterium]MBU1995732.1 hypothetical protein [Candidatus Omnitrophota bacterium]MBU4334539.1 hypothetical protein [Candidatus Omnitrophota bacterium]